MKPQTNCSSNSALKKAWVQLNLHMDICSCQGRLGIWSKHRGLSFRINSFWKQLMTIYLKFVEIWAHVAYPILQRTYTAMCKNETVCTNVWCSLKTLTFDRTAPDVTVAKTAAAGDIYAQLSSCLGVQRLSCCESPFTLREEHRLRVFENGVFRQIMVCSGR